MNPQFDLVKQASRRLNLLSEKAINAMLIDLADKINESIPDLLSENQKDLDRMDKNDPKFDRLKLTKERIQGIASDIKSVSELPSPLGMELDEREL
ncbi:MAG: gamma-glutamyl-phosphate reductase, partial [Bacteroidetes bacterium]|nr:gamma-glutamyl-phosphate reductase [Bacteroidota bacterium]